MIVDYDHNPRISDEQRLASLRDSMQIALNEIYNQLDNLKQDADKQK